MATDNVPLWKSIVGILAREYNSKEYQKELSALSTEIRQFTIRYWCYFSIIYLYTRPVLPVRLLCLAIPFEHTYHATDLKSK